MLHEKYSKSHFSQKSLYWFLNGFPQFFQHKLKNIQEVFQLKSILISKKILWRINFVLIKFSPNALLSAKLENECKNPQFLHKVTCIRSDHPGAVAKFHIHGFILKKALARNIRSWSTNRSAIRITQIIRHIGLQPEEHNIKVMEHTLPPPPPTVQTLTPAISRYSVLKKAFRGWQFHSYGELSTATQPFLTICRSPNFIKLLGINGYNTCRNAFWVEVAILRKIKTKMKMLVEIANKIFNHFFLWKLWQGSMI